MTTQPSVSELQAQIARLQQQIDEQQLSNLPAGERAAAQERLALQNERRAIEAEKNQIREAARMVHIAQLIQATGLSESDFEGVASTAEADARAREKLIEQMQDPAKLRQYADFMERAGITSTTTPPAEPAAPGADTPPSGLPAGQGGGAPVPAATEIADKIVDKFRGQGAGAIADFLGQYRAEVPTSTVSLDPNAPLDGTTGAPTPAALPPATQPSQQPAPVTT